MSHIATFVGGVAIGILLTMAWVFLLMREDRRSNEALATTRHDQCTPEWCPLIVNGKEMDEEEILSIQSCDHPHDNN